MLKIIGGHRSISDQFAHMTAQLALEPIIWSEHSLSLHMGGGGGGGGRGGGCTIVLISYDSDRDMHDNI